MSKKIFTDDEVEILSKNIYVNKVRNKGITYTMRSKSCYDLGERFKLLIKCKGDTFVFHTSKEELSMSIVQMPIPTGAFK